MSITSTDICQAADALKGFVGFNRKTGRYIVRFSEDSFGMDVADDSITPTSEFVWSSVRDDVMRLGREGDGVGPDFVCGIAIPCDAVGSGDHCVYFAFAHDLSRHRVADQGRVDTSL